MSPAERPRPAGAGAGGYRPQLGIDTGNGEAPDLVIARRECPPTGSVAESECFGYFRADRSGWKLIGEDVYSNCR